MDRKALVSCLRAPVELMVWVWGGAGEGLWFTFVFFCAFVIKTPELANGQGKET